MQFAVYLSRVFRVVSVRFLILGLVAARAVSLTGAPPPVPAPNLDIPRIIEEERRRLEAARAEPPEPELIGPPFLAEAIEENRKLLPGWVLIAQTAEKEGRIKDAIDMYIIAFDKMSKDEVMPFMPVEEIKPLAEALTRIQLQKAAAALKEDNHDVALIAIAELQSWMPELDSADPDKKPLESTRAFHAQAADLNRQVETARAEYKRRSPSRDSLTRLSELRGNKKEVERLLRDGMILYDAKDYDTANAYFERVIYLDPLNDRAEQYLKFIHNVRVTITDKRREQGFRERVHEVNKIWINDDRRHNLPVPNPYYRGPKGLNINRPGIEVQPTGGGGILPKFQSNLGAAKIHQKLATIRVPEVKPLNGLTLEEVVTLLDQAVRDADLEKKGINFRINTTIPWNLRQPQPPAVPGAPLAVGPRPRVNAHGLPILPDIKSEGSASGSTAPGKPAFPVKAPAKDTGKPQPKPVVLAQDASNETIDPSQIIIRGLTTPLRDLTVGALLQAISDSFNVPIKHDVSSFGITFSYRGPEQEKLYTQKFQLNPRSFMLSFGIPTSGSNVTFPKPSGIKMTPIRPQDFGHEAPTRGTQMQNYQSNIGLNYKRAANVASVDDKVYYAVAPGGGGAPGGGAPGGGGPNLVQATAASIAIENLFRDTYGLDVRVFFNEQRGIMLVRGSLSALEMVEQILDVFNASPPQVKMVSKFAEIEYDDNEAFGFDWFLGNSRLMGDKIIAAPGAAPTYIGEPSRNNPSGFFPYPGTLNVDQFQPSQYSILPSAGEGHLTTGFKQHGNPMATITGILTDPQFRMVITAMEQKEGVDVISAPEVITTSGQPGSIAIQDQRTVMMGTTPQAGGGGFGGPGFGTMMPQAVQVPTGVQFDALPYVSSDMFTIEMVVRPNFTEFLGYEDTTFEATAFAGGTIITQPIRSPRFRTRSIEVNCVVWDGYTVALAGLISETVMNDKDKVPFLGDIPFIGGLFRGETTNRKKKNMHIFITSTIIDPAGNPVNTEETLPFMRQPAGEVPNLRGIQP